jgi:hypothetical protein
MSKRLLTDKDDAPTVIDLVSTIRRVIDQSGPGKAADRLWPSPKKKRGDVPFPQRRRLSEEEFQELMKVAGGCCQICKRKPRGEQKMLVDHCHQTGHIRGLLCFRCNTGLGQFRDNVNLILAAAEYLRLSSQPSTAITSSKLRSSS